MNKTMPDILSQLYHGLPIAYLLLVLFGILSGHIALTGIAIGLVSGDLANALRRVNK